MEIVTNVIDFIDNNNIHCTNKSKEQTRIISTENSRQITDGVTRKDGEMIAEKEVKVGM